MPPPLFAATLNSVEGEWGCAAGVMGGGGGLVGGLKQMLESGKFAFAHTNKLLSH